MIKLVETKLARLYQHFTTAGYPCGIITAFRGNIPHEQNIQNNFKMASFFRQMHYGFVWLDGHWIENQDTVDERDVSEVSLLVIGSSNDSNKLLTLLVNQAELYNQDGFVYKNDDAECSVRDQKGERFLSFSGFAIDRISQAYSEIRGGNHGGRSFIFTEERGPTSFIQSLMMSKQK